MRLTCQKHVTTAVQPSPHVMQVAAMFGLGVDEQRELQLVPPTEIELRAHQLIFVTGASGSGKSTLLRLIQRETQQRDDAQLIDFDRLPEPPDAPLVDCFDDAPLDNVMRWLSLAGLDDAFVMLRRPDELSDGQRYRFRLARTIATVAQQRSVDAPLPIVLADEFAATLDRLTAQVLARNVRKWVDRTPLCFIAATTHDDLLESMHPDTLIEKHLGERLDVIERRER